MAIQSQERDRAEGNESESKLPEDGEAIAAPHLTPKLLQFGVVLVAPHRIMESAKGTERIAKRDVPIQRVVAFAALLLCPPTGRAMSISSSGCSN
jgi:hypothetical protein